MTPQTRTYNITVRRKHGETIRRTMRFAEPIEEICRYLMDCWSVPKGNIQIVAAHPIVLPPKPSLN